ncbi:MAG TPA: MCE family protein [Acidimicrobiales bacterium]|nr:MCE family protein [Acidimicrobiales bacterium]
MIGRLRGIFTRSFTERNPVVIGAVGLAVILVAVVLVFVLNRNTIGGGMDLTARFTSAAGLRGGDQVVLAGVPVGSVTGLHQRGQYVYADLQVDGSVQLPLDSTASIEVQTLLGALAVKFQPGGDWSHLLHGGDTVTRTTVPFEFQQLQNVSGPLLARSNAPALNQLLADLATITRGKQDQVARIIAGLDRLTGTVNARHQEVGQLIDSAHAVSAALASRDQQLAQAVDNFGTVMAGLAQRRQALSDLIANTRAVADQTAGLVGANRARLDGLLSTLNTDLDVVARHQVDLAQGLSYLASAVQGFSSIGYSGPSNHPNDWANIFTNLLGGGDAVYGSCGYLDQALDAALGPDPSSCPARVGPQ